MGSLNFLGKERVRFPITDEHSSLAVSTKKFVEFSGLKVEAEKRGLGSCVELKFCRLEMVCLAFQDFASFKCSF